MRISDWSSDVCSSDLSACRPAMFGELSGEERMKYNQPHAGASWGTQAKDWERGIDYDRLFKARLKRAQDAARFAGLGAVLCFNVANIRYVTGKVGRAQVRTSVPHAQLGCRHML